jgi:hypothetical protein
MTTGMILLLNNYNLAFEAKEAFQQFTKQFNLHRKPSSETTNSYQKIISHLLKFLFPTFNDLLRTIFIVEKYEGIDKDLIEIIKP